MKQLTRRYKYQIYPSPIQEKYLGSIFGSVRFVYNEFLKINQDMWDDGQITRLSRYEMQGLLPMYKDAYPWLSLAPSVSLQVATHDLDVAYQNFFQGKSSKPIFKKAKAKQSFQIPQPKIKDNKILLPNYKTWIPIKMHRDLPLDSKLGAATITKTPTNRYYISIVVTYISDKKLISKSNEMLGIDLNIGKIVLSTGEKITTPKILKTLELRKRRIHKSMQRQRNMSKGKCISNNYTKNRLKLAKLYEKIKFQKEDFLHKLALRLYRENQSIAMETLNIKGMVKNRRLSKAISSQSWGRFVEIMKMYANQYDKQLHLVSTWFPSSKMCSICGCINQELKLSDRHWLCSCGANHDRDINAAINIKNEGGSYPVKPVERKSSVHRPKRRTTMSSMKQESSKFEVVYESV